MKNGKNNTVDQDFISLISNISNEIEEYVDLVDDEVIFQFVDRAKRIANSISEIKRDGRQLKIGIIGCVKAGKSSFLKGRWRQCARSCLQPVYTKAAAFPSAILENLGGGPGAVPPLYYR